MGLLKKLRSFNKLYYLKLKSKVQLPLEKNSITKIYKKSYLF